MPNVWPGDTENKLTYPTFRLLKHFVNQAQQIRIANGAYQRRSDRDRTCRQRFHCAIEPGYFAIGRDREHRVIHAVEQGLELLPAALQGAKVDFQLARRFIESCGQHRDFIAPRLRQARSQMASGDFLRERHHLAQSPRNALCRDQRRDESKEQRNPGGF